MVTHETALTISNARQRSSLNIFQKVQTHLQSSFSDVRILFGAFLIIVLNQMDEKEVHQTWEW
jgi:hypothetical protein